MIDLIHRRRNCPTGMISEWVQKGTQQKGTKQSLFGNKFSFQASLHARDFSVDWLQGTAQLPHDVARGTQSRPGKRGEITSDRIRRHQMPHSELRPETDPVDGKPISQTYAITFCYTSGHDFLDAQRGSCLMNTHWDTVSSNRNHKALSLFSSTAYCASSTSTSNSTFPHMGFEPQTWKFL